MTSPHSCIGVLINQNGTVYLITPSGKMGIPSESVFNSWGYSFAKTVPANAADIAAPMSAGIMPAFALGRLSPYDSNTVVIPQSGPLTASASYDMPASGTIVSGQATADLAHFTFSGNGTLNSVTLQRIGVSSNTTLGNVYLYNGATRVADGASINQSGVITFGGLNLPVNGSVNLAVKADVGASGTAGQTVGVTLTGYAVTGGTNNPVSIPGNIMTIASAGLAGVSVQANTVSSASVNAGTNGLHILELSSNCKHPFCIAKERYIQIYRLSYY
jgi:hypothetical protein